MKVRTALSYIVQKIHQNDTSKAISLCQKEKSDVLVIKKSKLCDLYL